MGEGNRTHAPGEQTRNSRKSSLRSLPHSPWLVTDPNSKRHWVQRHFTPYIAPLFFSFGMWANFCAHTYGLITGQEHFSIGKL